MIKSRHLEAQRPVWDTYRETEEEAYRRGYAAFHEGAKDKRQAPLKPTRVNDSLYLSYIERFNQNCLAFDTGWSDAEFDKIHNDISRRYGLEDHLGTMLDIRFDQPWIRADDKDADFDLVERWMWNLTNLSHDWILHRQDFYFRDADDAVLYRLRWA